MRRKFQTLVIFFLSCLSFSNFLYASENGNRLIILTSFPSSMFVSFKEVFEFKHPNLKLHFIQKKTSAALSHIQDKSSTQVDIFWASAPDAFEVLKRSRHLQKLKFHSPYDIQKVSGYPIDDHDRFYLGFAISGYGLMWNEKYFETANLPIPRDWYDLINPVYKQHIGITAPSRSGTTHLIVETFLQNKGWDKGWKFLLELSGNFATITARSHGVRRGVEVGRFGVGLVIDFFGLSSRASGKKVNFIYSKDTFLLPANVAIVKGSQNVQAANLLIKFLRSREGQEILFKPEIYRMPVLHDVYEKAPKGFPNPFNGTLETSHSQFKSELSRKRYHLVNSLFDNLITFQLRLLQDTWKAIHEVENLLREKEHIEYSKQIKRARELVLTMPLNESQASEANLSTNFSRRKPGYPVSEIQQELENKWKKDARNRYLEAKKIAHTILRKLDQEKLDKRANRRP